MYGEKHEVLTKGRSAAYWKSIIGSTNTHRVPPSTWKTIQELGLGIMKRTNVGEEGIGKSKRCCHYHLSVRIIPATPGIY